MPNKIRNCSFCGNTSEDEHELLFEGKLRGSHTAYICRECIRTYADMLMVGLSECTCGSAVIHRTHPDAIERTNDA
ncbi:MAG: hypothetical protein AUG51_16970 [Acidobacteria bacterium 13_1_20CM_3_53_8]|nr:MAG: hypothetical protein AUG51_16970 [Acidobacteria bacterium 13_1_20CM_3_53_8]